MIYLALLKNFGRVYWDFDKIYKLNMYLILNDWKHLLRTETSEKSLLKILYSLLQQLQQ